MYLCSVCNVDNCNILPAHVCNSESVIKFNNNNNNNNNAVPKNEENCSESTRTRQRCSHF